MPASSLSNRYHIQIQPKKEISTTRKKEDDRRASFKSEQPLPHTTTTKKEISPTKKKGDDQDASFQSEQHSTTKNPLNNEKRG